MLIVCIDANVYTSAFAFGGKPQQIVKLALEQKFHLVTSDAILNEVKHNLTTKLSATSHNVDDFLNALTNITSVYKPTGTLTLINHTTDNLVLETALLGNANILVTGDKKDLLPLKMIHNMIIEPPSAFLDHLKNLVII